MLQVDFYWINREQRSFEWFVSLLSQLEIEQAEQGGAMERQDTNTFRQFKKILKDYFSKSGIEFCVCQTKRNNRTYVMAQSNIFFTKH
jgi:hypothetical protein